MNISNIINKIEDIDECKLENKIKYTLEQIWTNKSIGGTYKAYIIY
jgi:hypothetical protein